MLKHYLYILFIFFCSWTLLAQSNGQANVLIDSTTFLIGDQVNMQIIVNIPRGNTLTFPVVADVLTAEKLELVGQQPTEMIDGDVNNTYKTNLVITAWESGTYFVPALTFSYKKGGELVEFQSAAITLTVKSPEVTGDSTYVADIKTILAEEANFWDKLYYFFTHPVTVAIIILLLAFLAFYAFMRYKNRPKQAAPTSPEGLALQRLEALLANNPLEQHNFKQFHTEISFILRAYLNGRFAVAALEQPLSYFMPKVQQHNLMSEHLFEELSTVLEHADLIKFAKASPLDIANKKALDFSFELIKTIQEKLVVLAQPTNNNNNPK